jgi:predicted dehydrogenase
MITKIQILPTIYHLQRQGQVGEIHVCALNAAPLSDMLNDPALVRGFPGQRFTAHPDPKEVAPNEAFPDLYKKILAEAPRGSIVIVAVPDHLHYATIKEALANDLHVCSVKPLVLKYEQGEEVSKIAFDKGLLVGVEYHKRFDHRSLMARKNYRGGNLGEFRIGQAHLHEKWYYRDSNFQNWCTCENSDMFTYIGCHYVDLVAFITGLKPVSVSVYGIRDKYPNGKDGFLWTDARVLWEGGACLSVANAIGYPNVGAGGNSQGMVMWCQGAKDACLVFHSDQFRGVKCSYTQPGGDPGDTAYAEPNPDYFQLLDQGGGGLTPVGYGHRSVEYIVNACRKVAAVKSVGERQRMIRQYDEEGILATPNNSGYNELVIEAGRKSILAGGREVLIAYGASAGVRFRDY